MLLELFTLGERLAGQKDARLRRGLIFAFFEALTVAAPYALVLLFLRSALNHQLSTDTILWVTAGIVLSVLLRLVFSGAAMGNIFIAAHALMGKARIRTADHLRRLPMGFFMQQRSGELTGVLTTDIALVEDIWSHTIGIFASSFVLPLLVGIGLCFLDLRLGLVILAALPVALAVLAAVSPIFVREIESVLTAASDVNARVVEYVQGIAVLRAFGRHGEIYQRLVKAMERLRDALIRADVLPSPLLAAFGFVVEASFVAVAFAGSWLALHDAIRPDVLLVFLVVTVGVVKQVAELGVALLLLRASQRALARVDRLLAEPTLAEPPQPVAAITRFDVEVDNVAFAYEDEAVLAGVSARFPARSLTALVGASGSGKSTLVHLVARLWDIPREVARSASAAWTFATCPSKRCTGTSRWSSKTSCCSAAAFSTTSALASRTPRAQRSSAQRSLRAHTTSSCKCPTATTVCWEKAAARCPAVNGSACRSHAPS